MTISYGELADPDFIGPYQWVPASQLAGYDRDDEARRNRAYYALSPAEAQKLMPRFAEESKSITICSYYLSFFQERRAFENSNAGCPAGFIVPVEEFVDSAIFLICSLECHNAAFVFGSERTIIASEAASVALDRIRRAYTSETRENVRRALRDFVLEQFAYYVFDPKYSHLAKGLSDEDVRFIRSLKET